MKNYEECFTVLSPTPFPHKTTKFITRNRLLIDERPAILPRAVIVSKNGKQGLFSTAVLWSLDKLLCKQIWLIRTVWCRESKSTKLSPEELPFASWDGSLCTHFKCWEPSGRLSSQKTMPTSELWGGRHYKQAAEMVDICMAWIYTNSQASTQALTAWN